MPKHLRPSGPALIREKLTHTDAHKRDQTIWESSARTERLRGTQADRQQIEERKGKTRGQRGKVTRGNGGSKERAAMSREKEEQTQRSLRQGGVLARVPWSWWAPGVLPDSLMNPWGLWWIFFFVDEFSFCLMNFVFPWWILFFVDEFYFCWMNFLFSGWILIFLDEFCRLPGEFLVPAGFLLECLCGGSLDEFLVVVMNFLCCGWIFFLLDEFCFSVMNFPFAWWILFFRDEFYFSVINFRKEKSSISVSNLKDLWYVDHDG